MPSMTACLVNDIIFLYSFVCLRLFVSVYLMHIKCFFSYLFFTHVTYFSMVFIVLVSYAYFSSMPVCGCGILYFVTSKKMQSNPYSMALSRLAIVNDGSRCSIM